MITVPGKLTLTFHVCLLLMFVRNLQADSLYPAGGQRGTQVEVKVESALKGTWDATRIWSSQPGLEATVDPKKKTLSLKISPDASPGVAWLRVLSDQGASTPLPFVVGTLSETVEVEPNDRLTDTVALPSSQMVVNGKCNKSGDVDIYRVPLKAGETLVASVLANQVLQSPMDSVLQLLSPAGSVLLQNNDDHGLDSQLAWTAPTDGVYAVRLFAFPATPNSTIQFAGGNDYIYRLTLTTGPFVDHANPLGVQQNVKTQLRLAGWNLSEEQNKIDLTTDTRWTTVTQSTWANTTPVQSLNVPSVSESETPAPLTIPVAVTGVISNGETDHWRLTAKQGQKVTIRVQSRSLGQPLDPVLRVKDATGEVLKEVDDSTRGKFDVTLPFTFAAEGEYTIEVTDLHRRGGWRYAYLLEIVEPTPTVSLSVAATEFVLKDGKPLEIPVTVTGSNGVTEVKVEVDGLPEGVTAAPVTLPVKSKTAKLKLEAKPEVSFQGPLIIRGVVTKPVALNEPATASLTGTPDGRTTDLWLTVIPKK